MKSKWESDGDSGEERSKKNSKKKQKVRDKAKSREKTENIEIENKLEEAPIEVPPGLGPSREDTREDDEAIGYEDGEDVIGEYPGGWKITTEVVPVNDGRENVEISVQARDESHPFSIDDIRLAEKEFTRLWNFRTHTIEQCRSVDTYKKLNRINEGTYGVVYKAKDTSTGDIVALKRLKFEQEENGFPITSLREISSLLNDIKHPHVVNVREIVVGSDLNQVFMVMDYADHDLKALMEQMDRPFLQSEVKSIMLQILSAIDHLHTNWFVHRDLKTSNILINAQGEVKVADFGLTRKVGDPPGPMTQTVVTLWYRAPELLLGERCYSAAVDLWSVGCIYAELVKCEPIMMGRSEIDQLNQIFKFLGSPNSDTWPDMASLPHAKTFTFPEQPYSRVQSEFGALLTAQGIDFLSRLLAYDPKRRLRASDALKHALFHERPFPCHPSSLAKWITDDEIVKKSDGLEELKQQAGPLPSKSGFKLKF